MFFQKRQELKRKYNAIKDYIINTYPVNIRHLVEGKTLEEAKKNLSEYFDMLQRQNLKRKFISEPGIFSNNIYLQTYGKESFTKFKQKEAQQFKDKLEKERDEYQRVVDFLPYISDEQKDNLIQKLEKELKLGKNKD